MAKPDQIKLSEQTEIKIGGQKITDEKKKEVLDYLANVSEKDRNKLNLKDLNNILRSDAEKKLSKAEKEAEKKIFKKVIEDVKSELNKIKLREITKEKIKKIIEDIRFGKDNKQHLNEEQKQALESFIKAYISVRKERRERKKIIDMKIPYIRDGILKKLEKESDKEKIWNALANSIGVFGQDLIDEPVQKTLQKLDSSNAGFINRKIKTASDEVESIGKKANLPDIKTVKYDELMSKRTGGLARIHEVRKELEAHRSKNLLLILYGSNPNATVKSIEFAKYKSKLDQLENKLRMAAEVYKDDQSFLAEWRKQQAGEVKDLKTDLHGTPNFFDNTVEAYQQNEAKFETDEKLKRVVDEWRQQTLDAARTEARVRLGIDQIEKKIGDRKQMIEELKNIKDGTLLENVGKVARLVKENPVKFVVGSIAAPSLISTGTTYGLSVLTGSAALASLGIVPSLIAVAGLTYVAYKIRPAERYRKVKAFLMAQGMQIDQARLYLSKGKEAVIKGYNNKSTEDALKAKDALKADCKAKMENITLRSEQVGDKKDTAYDKLRNSQPPETDQILKSIAEYQKEEVALNHELEKLAQHLVYITNAEEELKKEMEEIKNSSTQMEQQIQKKLAEIQNKNKAYYNPDQMQQDIARMDSISTKPIYDALVKTFAASKTKIHNTINTSIPLVFKIGSDTKDLDNNKNEYEKLWRLLEANNPSLRSKPNEMIPMFALQISKIPPLKDLNLHDEQVRAELLRVAYSISYRINPYTYAAAA